jgi:hypothetical protein
MHRLVEIYADAGVFDPEQVRIITAAFDQTWLAVQDTGTPFASNGVAEATGDVVALRIIAMARLGELDRGRLREGALRYLAEMKETGTEPRVTETQPARPTGTNSPAQIGASSCSKEPT